LADSLFTRLTSETDDLHQQTLRHRTVLAIGDGSLPEATFRYYIEQDYQFLLRYTKVIALGVAASNDLAVTTRMSDLLHSTLAVEMDALRDLYSRFGGDPSVLEQVERSPTCAGYTNHLLAIASERNLLLTLTSILPCQWGYRQIGRSLKANGLPGDERYAAWIEEYADDGYGELVDWVIATLDNLAGQSGADDLGRTSEIFRLSSEYEHRFWDMAWNRERWD
jgi:thiaminase (transcriptional activator TenA)